MIVILLYVLPAIPYGIICFFAASIKMKYPKYILITGIGSIPSLVVDVCVGHIAMSTSWMVSIIIFAIIIVLLILMAILMTFTQVTIIVVTAPTHEPTKIIVFIWHLPPVLP